MKTISLLPFFCFFMAQSCGLGDNKQDIENINNETTIDSSITAIEDIPSDTIAPCISLLIEAAKNNDLDQAKQLLENGCDVNGRKNFGNNNWACPLRYSIHHEDSKMVELLLKFGADPNLDLGRQSSPFHCAACVGPLSTFKLLLEKGGDINSINPYASIPTPLLCAIDFDNNEKAKLLIQKGVKLMTDSIGVQTPLTLAAGKSNIEIVELLLQNGADINERYSEASEDCIVCPNSITVMHYVVGRYNNESPEKIDNTLKTLLKHKPNLNIENDQGYSALDVACFGKNIQLVDLLIAKGAKIESKGYSALHCAAMFSNVIMTKHLLELGANPNIKDEYGNTPLLTNYDCCGDGFGDSITKENRIKTIELLLDHGADPSIKNTKSESFLSECKKGHRKEISDLMVKRGLMKK